MTTPEELMKSAQMDLAKAMVPTPDDILADVGPLASVLYLDTLAWHVMTYWTGTMIDGASGDITPDDPPAMVLNALGQVVGMLDEVLVTLGMMPPEASAASFMEQS